MKKLTSLFAFVLLVIALSTMSSCKHKCNRMPVVELSDSVQADSTSVYDEEYGDTIDIVEEETEADAEVEPEPAPAPTNTFQSADDVLSRLAGKTFVHRGGR